MSLTEHDTGYFASLWIKASEAQVLTQRDAHDVASRALRIGENRHKPCAYALPVRITDMPKSAKSVAKKSHSAWVH